MSFCQYCGARLESAAADGGESRERARTHPESPLALGAPPAAAAQAVEPPAPEPAAAPRPPLPGTPPPPSRKPPPAPIAVSAPAPAAPPASPSVPPLGTAAQAGSLPLPPPAAPTGRFAPAALPVAPARLVVIAQDGSPGRDYPLVADHTDIGRDEGNILLPNDPYVSPRHARIQRRGGRHFVQDLDSVNGIFVRLRAPAKLEHGDLVLMGLEVLRFEVVSAADKGYGPATDRETQVFGSPAAPRFARLSQRTMEGVTRDTYFLTRDETVIGRESGDIVFTGDPFMSRRHSAISRDPESGGFSVRDLGSSNGTYLKIRGEHEITDGDHIRIGQHLFRLEVAPSGQA
jgi:pSer/pThr/pTyr-binding forkhead associated (FHA) protein